MSSCTGVHPFPQHRSTDMCQGQLPAQRTVRGLRFFGCFPGYSSLLSPRLERVLVERGVADTLRLYCAFWTTAASRSSSTRSFSAQRSWSLDSWRKDSTLAHCDLNRKEGFRPIRESEGSQGYVPSFGTLAAQRVARPPNFCRETSLQAIG